MAVVPTSQMLPFLYMKLDASGANTATDGGRTLLIGQKTSSGSATADAIQSVTSFEQAVELFGEGSEAAFMAEGFFRNGGQDLYMAGIADPSGGTAADVVCTVSGAPGEDGTLHMYVAGKYVPVALDASDAAADVAASIVDAVNAADNLPFTASAVAEVVTLTVRNAGDMGGTYRVHFNLNAGEEHTGSLAFALVYNAGSGSASLTGVIANMGEDAYDYIGIPSGPGAADMGTELSDSSGRWSPTVGLYGHAVTYLQGSYSSLVAAIASSNDQHLTAMAWEDDAPTPGPYYLGAFMAVASLYLEDDPSRPLQTLKLEGVRGASTRFTAAERNGLLLAGLGTCRVTQAGVVTIERARTTYTVNAVGAADNSYTDIQVLALAWHVFRALESAITTKYARVKLVDDDTRLSPGQAAITPSLAKGTILAVYSELAYKGWVEDVKGFASSLIVERNATDPNRLDATIRANFANQLRIFTILNTFIR